jgi:hypothetical protein
MKMNKSIKTMALVATSVLAVSCGSTQPPMPTLPSVNIGSIDGYEGNGSDIKNSKIIVAPGVKSNISADMQTRFASEITTIIVDSGSEVIDRKMASRFIDEIQLKENLSENYRAYEGPVEAKFAVIPTVTDISYGGEYKKARSSEDKKGKKYYHAAKCDYSAKTKANVQIRELPSMKQIMSFNVESSSSSSKENPPSSSCKEASMYNGVIAGAISELLEKGDDDYVTLSKYVGSQGVITGAKSFGGDLYFETNLGRLHGAKEEAQVAIYQSIDGELVLIAEGEMMDAKNVLRKKSYIEVDSDMAPMLKKGMIVMLSGKCVGYMCSMKSAIKSAIK